MRVLRNTRERGARKNSIPNCNKDIVNKMWDRSEPKVREFRIDPPCKSCRQYGHNIRSCPLRKVKELTPDDEIVQELLMPDLLQEGVSVSSI